MRIIIPIAIICSMLSFWILSFSLYSIAKITVSTFSGLEIFADMPTAKISYLQKMIFLAEVWLKPKYSSSFMVFWWDTILYDWSKKKMIFLLYLKKLFWTYPKAIILFLFGFGIVLNMYSSGILELSIVELLSFALLKFCVG